MTTKLRYCLYMLLSCVVAVSASEWRDDFDDTSKLAEINNVNAGGGFATVSNPFLSTMTIYNGDFETGAPAASYFDYPIGWTFFEMDSAQYGVIPGWFSTYQAALAYQATEDANDPGSDSFGNKSGLRFFNGSGSCRVYSAAAYVCCSPQYYCEYAEIDSTPIVGSPPYISFWCSAPDETGTREGSVMQVYSRHVLNPVQKVSLGDSSLTSDIGSTVRNIPAHTGGDFSSGAAPVNMQIGSDLQDWYQYRFPFRPAANGTNSLCLGVTAFGWDEFDTATTEIYFDDIVAVDNLGNPVTGNGWIVSAPITNNGSGWSNFSCGSSSPGGLANIVVSILNAATMQPISGFERVTNGQSLVSIGAGVIRLRADLVRTVQATMMLDWWMVSITEPAVGLSPLVNGQYTEPVGAVEFGDLNQDGTLDFGSMGPANGPFRYLFGQNTGGYFGIKTEPLGPFTGAFSSGRGFGMADINHDGWLDAAMSGQGSSGQPTLRIYPNSGGTCLGGQDLGTACGGPGSALRFLDIQNDGWPDLVASGVDFNGFAVTPLYVNNSGNFSVSQALFPAAAGVVQAAIGAADINRDGYQDLVIAGRATGSDNIFIFNNNGSGSFAVQDNLSVLCGGVRNGGIAMGDVDGDRDDDLVVSGSNNFGPQLIFFRNELGSWSVRQNLPGLSESSVALGDMDNDGDPDLVVEGRNVSGLPKLQIWRNDSGNFTFQQDLMGPADGLYGGQVTLGDIDADGDLDVAATGRSANGMFQSYLWTNPCPIPNTPPGRPVGVQIVNESGNLALAWNDASDDHSGAPWMHYQCVWAATPSDLSNKMKTLSLPAGQANVGNSYFRMSDNKPACRTVLFPGQYLYWAVRSIDSSFRVSAWTNGAVLPPFDPAPVEPNPGWGLNNGPSIAWADLELDGNQDLIVCGFGLDLIYSSLIFQNNSGTFPGPYAPNPGYGLEFASLACADSDLDGFPEIAVSGYDGASYRLVTFDNAGGLINPAINDVQSGWGVYHSAVAWGDFDNDGDPDLAVSGWDTISSYLRVYVNQGDGTFSPIYVNPCPPSWEMSYGSLAWGDFDKDGDLDLVASGENAGSPRLGVFLNNGDGTFDMTPVEPSPGWGLTHSSVAWADFDGDGDLDLAAAGFDGAARRLKIFVGKGDGNFLASFEPIPGFGLEYPSLAWGDFDNDGDFDLGVSGYDGSVNRLGVLVNQGTGSFVPSLLEPLAGYGIIEGDLAWVDFDNDGDLDLSVAGADNQTGAALKIFRNLNPIVNNPPSAPLGLTLTHDAGFWTVSWNRAADDHTFPKRLRYQIAVGANNSSIFDVVSPVFCVEGGDADAGNVLHTTNLHPFYRTSLPISSPICVKVQAIDSSFQQSAWSPVVSDPGAAPPDMSVITSIFSPSNTAVRVDWASVSGATGYKLYRADSDSGSGATVVRRLSGLQWTDKLLVPNKRYWYAVAATNANGEGLPTPWAPVMTLSAVPQVIPGSQPGVVQIVPAFYFTNSTVIGTGGMMEYRYVLTSVSNTAPIGLGDLAWNPESTPVLNELASFEGVWYLQVLSINSNLDLGPQKRFGPFPYFLEIVQPYALWPTKSVGQPDGIDTIFISPFSPLINTLTANPVTTPKLFYIDVLEGTPAFQMTGMMNGRNTVASAPDYYTFGVTSTKPGRVRLKVTWEGSESTATEIVLFFDPGMDLKGDNDAVIWESFVDPSNGEEAVFFVNTMPGKPITLRIYDIRERRLIKEIKATGGPLTAMSYDCRTADGEILPEGTYGAVVIMADKKKELKFVVRRKK